MEILSIPAEKCGVPGVALVGTLHVHAPTAQTPPLQSFLDDFSQQHAGKAILSHCLLPGLSESTRVASTAYAVQALTHYQTYLARPPGADLHPKKVNNLDPMAPVPVKNVNYPRAPSSRRSGLVGPHTTPAIVNYKHMTSTPREGYFWLPTLGT